MAESAVLQLLQATLPARHATAAIGHFRAAVLEYQKRNWGEATAKCGKFVEATLKALAVHVGLTLPRGRRFSVDAHVNGLAQAPSADDTVRLTIPRACRFIYEVASNRGARHDPGEIDPNEMDATAVLNLCSWVLAELVRYSQRGGDLTAAAALITALMQRRYPFIEEVDGRVYFHVRGASARDIALLILWHSHPRRVPRQDIVAAVRRHRFSANNANVAATRLASVVDDDGHGRLRLLGPGMVEAERLVERAEQRER